QDLLLFFQAEDGIRDFHVTGVQTCALPISLDYAQRGPGRLREQALQVGGRAVQVALEHRRHVGVAAAPQLEEEVEDPVHVPGARSEERRVGQEGRSAGPEAEYEVNR